MPARRPRRDWSIEEKIRILAKASPLTGAELTDFLQREGVPQAEYEQWRLALGEDGGASLATVKRIRAALVVRAGAPRVILLSNSRRATLLFVTNRSS